MVRREAGKGSSQGPWLQPQGRTAGGPSAFLRRRKRHPLCGRSSPCQKSPLPPELGAPGDAIVTHWTQRCRDWTARCRCWGGQGQGAGVEGGVQVLGGASPGRGLVGATWQGREKTGRGGTWEEQSAVSGGVATRLRLCGPGAQEGPVLGDELGALYLQTAAGAMGGRSHLWRGAEGPEGRGTSFATWACRRDQCAPGWWSPGWDTQGGRCQELKGSGKEPQIPGSPRARQWLPLGGGEELGAGRGGGGGPAWVPCDPSCPRPPVYCFGNKVV